MSGFEENEISKNANGGTEISKRLLAKVLPEDLQNEFQIIASRFRQLEEDKIRVYWIHDMAGDPELENLRKPEFRDKFHKIIFNTHFQMNDFITKYQIPYDDKLEVIELPVKTLELKEKPKDKVNLIYFSTPQRGLDILIPVFEALCDKHDNIHLHVFSSFKIYGWDEVDKNYEPLYDMIRNHPHMTYHGYAPQEDMHKVLQESHILAYPNTWPETACRVLIESMSAGLMCVHPNLAALSDTSGMLTSMYQFQQDMKVHANIFYQYLDHAIQAVNREDVQQYLKFVKAYADNRFNADKISQTWEYSLRNLLEKYPTVESRKTPEQMFVYKV